MHKGGGNRNGKKAATDGKRPNASGRKQERSSKPKHVKSKQPKPKEDGLIRLNKYISNSGICSRREADTYIATGSVTVNGKVILPQPLAMKKEIRLWILWQKQPKLA